MEPSDTSKPRDPRALNAYRHGLTGQIVILSPADRAAYDRHCKGILQSLAPVGDLETGLVQSICDDRWRLSRAAIIESVVFANTHQDEGESALAQARQWLATGKHLQLLTLYESRIQRRVEKNLALLRQLQQDRKAALQQSLEEARLLAQLAEAKGETFDVESDFPREFLPPEFVFSTASFALLTAHHRRLSEARMRFSPSPKNLPKAA